MSVLNRTAVWLTNFVAPIYVLRAPIIATTASCIMLTEPGQTLEIYRALALDRADHWPQIVLAFASLMLAGVMIWYIGRTLTLRWQPDELTGRTFSGILLRWLPRLLGAAPLFAAAIGMHKSSQAFRPIEVPGWVEAQMPAVVESIRAAAAEHEIARQLLVYAVAMAIGLGLLLIAVTFFRSYRRHWKYETPNPWVFGLPTRIFFYLMTLGLVLLFSTFFAGVPARYGYVADLLGTFTIFNLFMICLAFFLSALTNVYDRTRIPALSLLIFVGVVATAFDFNDNHEVRTIGRDFRALPSASKGFQDWLASRPDREYFRARGEPYPVYVVAAQGGGLYAAQHAATALARMQDRCAGFAQHVFAISGVSGGSLGAALFTSLVKEKAEKVAVPTCRFGDQPPGWYETATAQFMARDFMAPLAAAGLFPDFLQRFLPWPIPEFDRARALEGAFERAWTSAVADSERNPFADSYYRHWEASGVAPALVLNATSVKTGIRVAISPFRFYKQTTIRLATLNSIIRADLPLSTAVGVSARFPWILPPASWRRGGEQYRFVDGAYFENSGIDTALDLVGVLEDDMRRLREETGVDPNVAIHLVVMSSDDILEDPVNTNNAGASRFSATARSGFDELMSPIESMLSSRVQRGVLSAGRAFDKFCDDCVRDREDQRLYAGIDGRARFLRLNFTDFVLTLGWQLSSVSRTLVSAHSGYPDRCLAARKSLRDRWPWIARVFNENNCASCQMMYTLTGRARELDQIVPAVSSSNARTKGDLATWVQLCRAEIGNSQVPTYTESSSRTER